MAFCSKNKLRFYIYFSFFYKINKLSTPLYFYLSLSLN
nr:MAG TPA: hypothetical protein [Bacteriophage sp.]